MFCRWMSFSLSFKVNVPLSTGKSLFDPSRDDIPHMKAFLLICNFGKLVRYFYMRRASRYMFTFPSIILS
jgi:hypothetical protein